jgi:hypothetical protein
MMQATVLDRPTTVDGGAISGWLGATSAERNRPDASAPVAQSWRHELATRWYRTEDERLEALWLLTPPANVFGPRTASASTSAILA